MALSLHTGAVLVGRDGDGEGHLLARGRALVLGVVEPAREEALVLCHHPFKVAVVLRRRGPGVVDEAPVTQPRGSQEHAGVEGAGSQEAEELDEPRIGPDGLDEGALQAGLHRDQLDAEASSAYSGTALKLMGDQLEESGCIGINRCRSELAISGGWDEAGLCGWRRASKIQNENRRSKF